MRSLLPIAVGVLLSAAQMCAAPVLVSIPGIVSSGAGLSQGAQDVNFLLVSAPAGVSTVNPSVVCSGVGCASDAAPAFPFWPNGWVSNDANSQWVGINPVQYGNVSAQSGSGTGVTTGDPSGWYTFRVYFYLPDAQAASTATISGSWSADNYGGIFLNDTGTYSTSDASYQSDAFVAGTNGRYPYGWSGTDSCMDGDAYCFLAMHSFNISSGFVVGLNYVDFRVYNVSQSVGNPVGFRVSWSGTYEAAVVPEPAAASLWLVGLAALALLRRRKKTV
jgi:hypothetical protein